MVGAAMAEREAWADVDVSASDLSHLSGSRDGWDQAGMSATSARSTARTVAYARERNLARGRSIRGGFLSALKSPAVQTHDDDVDRHHQHGDHDQPQGYPRGVSLWPSSRAPLDKCGLKGKSSEDDEHRPLSEPTHYRRFGATQ